MANKEQLAILKQGVEVWNKWREVSPDVKIDLTEADLAGANLTEANLKGADLREVDLSWSDLNWADLGGANLGGAKLNRANLEGVNLGKADLEGAQLIVANLYGADLRGANFGHAHLGGTVLTNIDLSETKGLDEVLHRGFSTIGTDTVRLSKGKISDAFLRGCGLSDLEIEFAKIYQTGLSAKEVNEIIYRFYDLRANQAIQINPLFVSYSHKDEAFVDELEKHLNESGIRFWRDIHDGPVGPLETIVDRAIRQNLSVLVILSEHSVQSDWVEYEARIARGLEIKLRRHLLCPVALDSSWKTYQWPGRLRKQIEEYTILDFSKWRDEGEMERMFRKLVDGLDLFYKE